MRETRLLARASPLMLSLLDETVRTFAQDLRTQRSLAFQFDPATWADPALDAGDTVAESAADVDQTDEELEESMLPPDWSEE